jgi:predicted amino acid-binding ACT domain protein
MSTTQHSLKTYIPTDKLMWDAQIQEYLVYLEKNANELCVLTPLYRGIPFVAKFSLDFTNPINSSAVLTFIFVDIENQPHTEQLKHFKINNVCNSKLFTSVRDLHSLEFRTYLTNVNHDVSNIYQYAVEGTFTIPLKYLYNEQHVSVENFQRYCHNVTFNEDTLRKRIVIHEKDIFEHLKTENEYVGPESDMLSLPIFSSEFWNDTDTLINNFVITSQHHPNFPLYKYHFKNVEELQYLANWGFTTRVNDIYICLPSVENITRHVEFLYNSNDYVLQGISLECDTYVAEQQSINLILEQHSVL